ncbi:unnamed protein product [Caenorhabditis auriculariae]|uniref:Uncharacterized protein n=1 Tax=Caenorhabditis auriculariae TaxID=2777116 RepID=A0A8S1HTT7_9PELO|nr:unnamed protein product [Caenorhabditis auriculariae]
MLGRLIFCAVFVFSYVQADGFADFFTLHDSNVLCHGSDDFNVFYYRELVTSFPPKCRAELQPWLIFSLILSMICCLICCLISCLQCICPRRR